MKSRSWIVFWYFTLFLWVTQQPYTYPLQKNNQVRKGGPTDIEFLCSKMLTLNIFCQLSLIHKKCSQLHKKELFEMKSKKRYSKITFLESLTIVHPGNLPWNQSCHLCRQGQRKTWPQPVSAFLFHSTRPRCSLIIF